jgi:hypothetical protein
MKNMLEALDLVKHLYRAREFSFSTFGPPNGKPSGVIDHLRKELVEVDSALSREDRLDEWVDIMILAMDGAMRDHWTPRELVTALVDKQARNEARKWPDWRTCEPGKAIEHIREPGIDPNRGTTYGPPYAEG